MTDPIIDRLDQIKGRADKATPGPWEWSAAARVNPANGPTHHAIRAHSGVVAETDYDIHGALNAEFIIAARTDVVQMEQALRAVLDLHKPEVRYLVWGYEEVSFSSVEDAAEFVGQPVEAEEFKLCAECKRVEDGAADNAAEIGYETSLWPCPTVTRIKEALG